VAALEAARQRSGVQAGVTVIQACPHCGSEVIVLTTLIAGTALFQKPRALDLTNLQARRIDTDQRTAGQAADLVAATGWPG
jgi:hypothetical protein